MKIKQDRQASWLAIALLLFFAISETRAAQHYPAEATEPAHAKALIQYNEGRYSAAMAILNDLLGKYPEYVPALELKALVLRREKRNDEALATYQKLIAISSTPALRAPYHFDSGSIYYERKNFVEAKKQFEQSIRGGFNYGASNYFIGLIAFTEGHLEDAEWRFNATHWSAAKDLHGMAAFYLGLIHAKMGTPTGVLWGFKGADDYAKQQADSLDKATRDAVAGVRKVTQQVLENYDRNQFYGSIMLTTQYDTNLPNYPDVIANQQPSGRKSMKGVGAGTLGFMTSPVRNWQVNVSYRNYYNHNFNKDSKGYAFFSNIPSVVFTVFPAKRMSFGIKNDGNLTYNDRQEGGKTVFRPFSLTGNFGPFVRLEYVPRLVTTAEITYRPKKYFLDTDTQRDLNRTGNGVFTKFNVSWDSLKKWLNPSGFVSYEDDATHGVEFRADIWMFSAVNTFILSSKDTLSASVEYTKSRFGERRGPVRVDKLMSYRLLFSHVFTKHLAGLIDVSYSRNLSTLPDSYEYSRFLSSVGVNLSF